MMHLYTLYCRLQYNYELTINSSVLFGWFSLGDDYNDYMIYIIETITKEKRLGRTRRRSQLCPYEIYLKTMSYAHVSLQRGHCTMILYYNIYAHSRWANVIISPVHRLRPYDIKFACADENRAINFMFFTNGITINTRDIYLYIMYRYV